MRTIINNSIKNCNFDINLNSCRKLNAHNNKLKMNGLIIMNSSMKPICREDIKNSNEMLNLRKKNVLKQEL